MTTKMIKVPANRLDDRTYTHHLIPHIIKELNKKTSPIIVITDKELFAHGLIVASKEEDKNCIHHNELNKFYFNILKGSLTENLYLFDNLGLLNKLLPYTTTEAFFFQTSQFVMRNALYVIKRLYGDDATLSDLSTLLRNCGGNGRMMVNHFIKLPDQNVEEAKKREEIALWFLNDYFTGISGDRGSTKTYDYASSVRTNLTNFIEEWSTVCGMEKYAYRGMDEETIPTDINLITINLSTIKSNKANIVTYLIHKLSQSTSNSIVYVDVSNTDDIKWDDVLLNNRSISTITQVCSNSNAIDSSLHCSTKRIQSFRGSLKFKVQEIEEQMRLYYQKLNNKNQKVIEDEDEDIVDAVSLIELELPSYAPNNKNQKVIESITDDLSLGEFETIQDFVTDLLDDENAWL